MFTKQQRAYLAIGATYNRDVVQCGKVVRRGDSKSTKAVVAQGLIAAKRDRERATDKTNQDAMLLALGKPLSGIGPCNDVTAKVTKGGYGGRCYAKRKTSAMPMNFWRGTGYGA